MSRDDHFDFAHSFTFGCCSFLKRLWRLRLRRCLSRCCRCSKCCEKVTPERPLSAVRLRIQDYMERERLKPELGEFTLMEYQEKILVYGFLMVGSHR